MTTELIQEGLVRARGATTEEVLNDAKENLRAMIARADEADSVVLIDGEGILKLLILASEAVSIQREEGTPADPDPTKYRTIEVCAECGGQNVQVAMWIDPNTRVIFEDYGSWDCSDTNWCSDCDEHQLFRTVVIHAMTCDMGEKCTCGGMAKEKELAK